MVIYYGHSAHLSDTEAYTMDSDCAEFHRLASA